MPRQQLPQEGLLQLEDRIHRHQHHHDLTGGKAPLDEHMAQPAGAIPLVKNLDLEGAQHAADIPDDGVGGLILDVAAVHRDDGVAARLIDAGDDLPPPIQGEGGVDFIAIMARLLHPQDGEDRRKLAQQLLNLFLLAAQLLGIGEVLQLAAAAFAEMGAGRGIGFGHCITPHFKV